MEHRFLVTIEQSVEVVIDDAVIRAVDDEWRSNFYPLTTPDQIAEHLGRNYLVNQLTIDMLDGFADQPRSRVAYRGEEIVDSYAEPIDGDLTVIHE